MKSVEESPECRSNDEDSSASTPVAQVLARSDEDEDDRRTIRGESTADDRGGDKTPNGNGHPAPEEPEKQAGKEPPPAPLAPSVPHIT